MARLDGKVTLVTGASSGIGRAVAVRFAAAGSDLALTARRADKLAEAGAEAEEAGAAVVALPLDVTQADNVDRLFAACRERFGRLDLVVNNAGRFDGGPLDSLPLAAWEAVIATNLTAPMLCTRAAMPIMKAQGGGRIINIGSISAKRVRPDMAPYNASKHGLWGLTQSTALEGREHGITCSMLNPGNVLVDRRVGGGRPQDSEPMIAAEDIAELALAIAAMPPHVEVLETTVLPHTQRYVGRG